MSQRGAGRIDSFLGPTKEEIPPPVAGRRNALLSSQRGRRPPPQQAQRRRNKPILPTRQWTNDIVTDMLDRGEVPFLASLTFLPNGPYISKAECVFIGQDGDKSPPVRIVGSRICRVEEYSHRFAPLIQAEWAETMERQKEAKREKEKERREGGR